MRQAERLDEPVVIHCITKKGYGFNRAEKNAERFHGTPPFYLDEERPSALSGKGNGEIATEELLKLAKNDQRIQFITAAMPLGTGTPIRPVTSTSASRKNTALPCAPEWPQEV